MSKRTFSGILLSLLLVGMLTLAFSIQPVKAPSTTIIVPNDYPTIQEAINAASDGDTVFVRNGTYCENVVVNKSVSLVGEAEDSTIINGTAYKPTIDINIGGVEISAFGVKASSYGVAISMEMDENVTQVDDCVLRNLIVNGTIMMTGDKTNGNTVTGIDLHGVLDVEVPQKGNIITDNKMDGIVLWQTRNNTISNNLIRGMHFFDGIYGIYGYESLYENRITHNIFDISGGQGILLYYRVEYNSICENTFLNNTVGIELDQEGHLPGYLTANNEIFHNNFITNENPVVLHADARGNIWDNGYPSGGNYWSDYAGVDMYHGASQNIAGSDTIGDTPYVVDANNIDHYPFMTPWSAPPVLYQLTVTSTSTTGMPFTINAVSKTTPYTESLPEGYYTLEMPQTFNGYKWSKWLEDGDTSRTKTIYLHGTTWTGVYTVPVGGEWAPINTAQTVTPWIALAFLAIAFAAAGSHRLLKKHV
jgi:nitrous oxidase accessory protein NosD